MKNIINKIRSYYPVSDASIEVLASHLKRVTIPPKTIIIHAGTVDRHVYFIEKGIARVYIMKGDEQLADLTKCEYGIYMIHYFFIGYAVILMRMLHVPLGLQIPCALTNFTSARRKKNNTNDTDTVFLRNFVFDIRRTALFLTVIMKR